MKNCDIIRGYKKYSDLIDCVDARIRHSESHINTDINEKLKKIILREDKNGKIIEVGEYTFEKFIEITAELERGLFPAFLLSFFLHEIALIDMVLTSKEYHLLLLGINNIK